MLEDLQLYCVRLIVCVFVERERVMLLKQGSGNEAPGSVGDSTGSRVSTRLKVVLLLYLSNCV